MNIFPYITSLFSEQKCYACGQVGHFFCLSCKEKMSIYSPYCYVCKKSSEDFNIHQDCIGLSPLSQIIVLTRYRQAGVKKLLRHAKYYGKYQAYQDLILQNKDFFQNYIQGKNSVLIPLPMHFWRRWKRGYNQSEKIANYISSILDISVNNRLLYKKKYTKHQSHLSQHERQKNLQSSFGVRNNKLPLNITLYLIDDVVSTGSTLLEAAKELRKFGFTDVRAIVLASD